MHSPPKDDTRSFESVESFEGECIIQGQKDPQ